VNVVEKALWFIEWKRHISFDLAEVAKFCEVSRFHVSRVFGDSVGLPLMEYARARKLSEAARTLANGRISILEVALDSGYQTHEAFSRAFRDQFGTTPREIRRRRTTNGIKLVEPFQMDTSLIVALDEPRFETHRAFQVTGLSDRYTFETNLGIPALWEKFLPHIGHISGEVKGVAYGVCANFDGKGHFDYYAAVETAPASETPGDLSRLTIPEQRYVVFTHTGPVAKIRKTVYTIWNQWFPQADVEPAGGTEFELYDERFDRSDTGQMEIWIPVK
jgi:AraC family transcriptional regulator